MRGTQFVELSAFVAVAEHKSFTKAAENLCVVRSSVSQSVRSLEERLGVRLLNRTTRSVALTNAGVRLLADAQPILDGIDKCLRPSTPIDRSRLRKPSGRRSRPPQTLIME
jgi:DNA-binding transcriptional LysR family regulator